MLFLAHFHRPSQVRVQGGAYGCSLGLSRLDGTATFTSYRDPSVAGTLSAYDGAAAFLRANPLSPEELDKAVRRRGAEEWIVAVGMGREQRQELVWNAVSGFVTGP